MFDPLLEFPPERADNMSLSARLFLSQTEGRDEICTDYPLETNFEKGKKKNQKPINRAVFGSSSEGAAAADQRRRRRRRHRSHPGLVYSNDKASNPEKKTVLLRSDQTNKRAGVQECGARRRRQCWPTVEVLPSLSAMLRVLGQSRLSAVRLGAERGAGCGAH